MAVTTVNGVNLHYEVLGAGDPILLTPGGRGDMETTRPLAQKLAARYRVIIWDRRNCGSSDIAIEGHLSEQELIADDAFGLLNKLGAGPVYAAGGSGGTRQSLLLAIRHPEAVKGLLLTAVTGWPVGAEYIAENFYTNYIEAAKRGGMQAVIEQGAPSDRPGAKPFFAERIRQNPLNRQRLLSMDPSQFIQVMDGWRAFILKENFIAGISREQLAQIRMPTLAMSGGDDVHPTDAALKVASVIPHCEFHRSVITPSERGALTDQSEKLMALRQERVPSVLLDFLSRSTQGQPVGSAQAGLRN